MTSGPQNLPSAGGWSVVGFLICREHGQVVVSPKGAAQVYRIPSTQQGGDVGGDGSQFAMCACACSYSVQRTAHSCVCFVRGGGSE